MEPIEVLYRDRHYVAVDKPAGLLVHRSAIDPGERRALVQRVRNQVGQRVYPVHRLDRPTQGIVVFAFDSEAAAKLQSAFRGEQVEKTYLAVVRGYCPSAGLVDHPLRDVSDPRIERSDSAEREARTKIRTIKTIELPFAVGRYPTARYSLTECRPITGRRHQIRRHLKHLHHPVIGDANYGDGRHNRLWRDHLGIGGLLLASIGLAFRHPYSGEPVELSVPPGRPLRDAIEIHGWVAVESDR